MNKIAFYLRLSMADGDMGKDNKDESNSIENQRLLLEQFVEMQDALDGEIEEYIDDGYSGTNFDRPAFQRMLEDAKQRKIQTILVKDLSRLGRDYIGVGDYLEQIFPLLGIRFIAINSNYDSDNYVGSTMGLEMSVSNLINSLYSKDLSKKFKSAVQTKWKQGISTAGRVPFGYQRDKTNKGRRVIDPVSSKYVRTIFELALEDWDTAMIANYLNEAGIPTPGQYRKMCNQTADWYRKVTDEEWMWDGRKVWCVLKNYEYTGALIHGKTSAIAVGSKSRRNNKPSDWYVTEGAFEGIVTKEEFENAQAVIIPAKMNKMRQDTGFSLRGKVRCGNCHLLMAYDGNGTPTLTCAHSVSSGKKSTCDKTRHEAKRIEGIVHYQLCNQLRAIHKLGSEFQKYRKEKNGDIQAQKKKMEHELEVLKEEKIRQYEAYASGVLTKEVYIHKKEVLTGKIQKQDERYKKVCDLIGADDKLSSDVQWIEDKAKKINVYDKLTREAVNIFIDTVYLYDPQRIEIIFVFENILQELMWRFRKENEEKQA